MALRDLFGKAKSGVKKAGKQAKRAEDYGQRVYDREVEGAFEAHDRGSQAVGEFGDRAFGMEPGDDDNDDDDDGPTPIDVALGTGDSARETPDVLGGSGGRSGAREMPDPMGGGGRGDSTPGVPDVMGDRSDDRDLDLW